jgi:hypothetical protein
LLLASSDTLITADQGNDAAGIETSPMTFVNHGCNKTYSIGKKLGRRSLSLITTLNNHNATMNPLAGEPTDVSELTVDLTSLAQQTVYVDKNEPYHPYNERHYPSWFCPSFKALRDIKAGEELLDNYMVMAGPSELYDFVSELQSMCSGGIGSVTRYELQARESESATVASNKTTRDVCPEALFEINFAA